jgi:hypothetical protein
MAKKMAAMRAAKERKRIARGRRDEPPKMIRSTGLSFAIRDDLSGDVVWMPLVSARDVFRRVTVVLKYYMPGKFKP